jgi:hypothetical protein
LLVLTYVYAVIFPGGAADALALTPDKVVPRLWSLGTAGFYEWNAVSLALHTGVVFTLGQRVERVWGAKEYIRFVCLVNTGVGCATFCSMFLLYVATADQYYLFTTFGGFQGVTAGLLVAYRQVAPEEAVASHLHAGLGGPLTGLRAKHLLHAYVALCGALAALSGAEHHHVGLFLFVLYGAHVSWLYLRFFQPVASAAGATGVGTASAGMAGDPRPEFSFAALWPTPLQPCIENVCSAPCFALCCMTRGSGGAPAMMLGPGASSSGSGVYRGGSGGDGVNGGPGSAGCVARARQEVLAQRGSALLDQRLGVQAPPPLGGVLGLPPRRKSTGAGETMLAEAQGGDGQGAEQMPAGGAGEHKGDGAV